MDVIELSAEAHELLTLLKELRSTIKEGTIKTIRSTGKSILVFETPNPLSPDAMRRMHDCLTAAFIGPAKPGQILLLSNGITLAGMIESWKHDDGCD